MNRTALLWVLVLFFGTSLLFGSLRRLTEGESTAVIAGVQVGALVLVVVGIVLYVRRTR
ncbi:MAG TPA: hypothetical protein VNT32_14815 [Thermoleophilaceae bacterium]|nr:hypothetical protein [Thermoleophilaceae bacterium]